MSIGELKIKISKEYDIPTNVQRWMINKIVANRDDMKLDEFQTTNDSTIFLYVVAPGDFFFNQFSSLVKLYNQHNIDVSELKTIIEKPQDQVN